MKEKIYNREVELIFEQSETLVVRRRREIDFVWCALCGRKVKMLEPEAAAQITGVSRREIYQAIEGGRIHFVELPDKALLICLDSLNG